MHLFSTFPLKNFTFERMKSQPVKKGADTETPLMKQYNTIKAKYPDALLLFRVGDFYETFKGKGSFEGWMKRIMINTFINPSCKQINPATHGKR